MLKKVFRVVLTVCGMLLGYGVSTYLVDNWDVLSGLQSTERILAVVLFTGIIGIIFFNFFSILSNQGRRVANSVDASVIEPPVGNSNTLIILVTLASAIHIALKTRTLILLDIKKPPLLYRRRVGSQHMRQITEPL